MPMPDNETVTQFLNEKIQLWNDGKREELAALYKKFAAEKLTFEYVGGPILDGWQAFEDMWQQFGDSVEIELIEVLINGNEVACYLKNHRRGQPGVFNPTIEIYQFGEGTLHERYFFGAGAAEA